MDQNLWVDSTKRSKEWLKVSPTGLSNFLECDRCGYRKVHEVEMPKIKYPRVPNGVDLVLKRLSNLYRLKGTLPPRWKDLLPGRRLYSEEPKWLSSIFEEERLTVRGEPDELVLEKDGTLSIVDFKTRGYMKDGVYESYKWQMNCYGLLLKRTGGYPKLSGRAYLIFFTPELRNADLEWNVSLEEVEVRPAAALELIRKCNAILRRNTIPTPSPQCEACNWIAQLPPRRANTTGWIKEG